MRDVAQAAGVSQSTVSKALRNDPSIPEATRERIQLVAHDMQYRPNPMVATLMAQLHGRRTAARAPILAVIGLAGDCGEQMFLSPAGAVFLEGARKRADTLGYALEMQTVTPGAFKAQALSRQLRYRGVVGVLVMPLPPGVHDLEWDFSCFASVALGRSLYAPRLHHVSPHHSANIMLLFRALTQRGFKRIGLIMSRHMSAQVEDGWLSGYARLYHTGVPGTLPPCIPEVFGKEAVREWIEQHQPDALIAKETHLVPRWLSELGHAIPLFSPGRISEKDHPGIDEDREQVGAAAIDTIIAQIHSNTTGIPSRPQTLLIAGHLSLGVERS